MERTNGVLRNLVDGLVVTVGQVQNNLARLTHRVVNGSRAPSLCAEPIEDRIQMLLGYQGRLVPIEEPIDLAERAPTPHPCEVINLTLDDDNDYLVPDSEEGSDGSFRDFAAEEAEQATNEEYQTEQAAIAEAAADPAPEYLPPYQDPPGIDEPFLRDLD